MIKNSHERSFCFFVTGPQQDALPFLLRVEMDP